MAAVPVGCVGNESSGPASQIPSTLSSTSEPTPMSMSAPTPTSMPEPTPTSTSEPIGTPESTSSPNLGFGPGTYQVGSEIQPGVYAGKAGTDRRDSCYWERLSGVAGESSEIIANDNVVGQFYIEILSTDKYFTTRCDMTLLSAWPEPEDPVSDIGPGTYLVGRDIAAGTYRGKAGTGVHDSCYWERLSGVTGEFSDLIANENATGAYFVSVEDSDYALSTACALELVEQASPAPTSTPTPAATRPPNSTSISEPIGTPESTSSPNLGFGPGTYQLGSEIQPGVYAGKAGTDRRDSCYWERLSGVAGESSEIIANDNVVGQFYIEILSTDKYFTTRCDMTLLSAWPEPEDPVSDIGPGTYLVGRDIAAGTYRGKAGTGVRDSCYWERLSGVTGEFSDLIANENATGAYFVGVKDSDYALSTACALELVEQASPAPTSTPEPTPTSMTEPTSTSTPTPDPSGRWETFTYDDNLTGQSHTGVRLNAVWSNERFSRGEDEPAQFVLKCDRDSALYGYFEWPGAFIAGRAANDGKLPSEWVLDGVRHVSWWLEWNDESVRIAPEDLQVFLSRVSSASVLGIQFLNDGVFENEEKARFEVPGIVWALEQLPCSVPTLMATLSEAKLSLVRVEVHDAAGSGVVVGTNQGHSLVLTAWHVVESFCDEVGRECVGVSVVAGGERYHGSLRSFNPQEDLAVVDVEGVLPIAKLASGVPELETDVVTIGFPEGEHDFQYNQGRIVRHSGCSFESCLATNAQAWSGFSGGALINLEGEIVGVISEGWSNSYYSNAVSVDAIQALLQS